MISKELADEIISSHLNKLSKSHKTEIIVENIQENDFCWIYSYNTKEFINDKNSLNMLLGQGYLVVDRMDSSLNDINLTVEEEIIGISVLQKYLKKKYNIPIPNEEERKLKRRKDAETFYKELEKKSMIKKFFNKILNLFNL